MLQATTARYNLSATTLIHDRVGRVCRVSVTTAGTTVGAIHDANATGDAAAGNKIWTVPNTVGVYDLDWPVGDGIVFVPGTSQVVSVSYR